MRKSVNQISNRENCEGKQKLEPKMLVPVYMELIGVEKELKKRSALEVQCEYFTFYSC
jgi:hypothetical protein